MTICIDCGGYDELGTCVCYDEFSPESDMSCRKLTKDERTRRMDILTDGCDGYDDEPEAQPKQICHFCGVDLWLQRTDLNIRMCVPCGLELDHQECCKCIVCDKVWMVDGEGSVCEFCMTL